MLIPVVLAHGALGNFDELIYISVVVIFLVFMGIAWVRGRMTQPDFDSPGDRSTTPDADSPERFKLD